MPSPGLRKRVEAIPGIPLPNGLLGACAAILDVDPSSHELLGVDWQPMSCCDASCWPDPCDDDSPGESPAESLAQAAEKHFCRPDTQTTPPVAVYAGVECSTMGFGYAEAVTRARTALQLGRQRALEQWVWTNILGPMAIDRTPPGGPVGIPQAMGLIEGWLANDYGGVGVIHAPAAAGPLLCAHSQVHREGQRLRTCASQHCVVLGAGYQVNTGPDGQPAPDGAVWLAASGPVTIRREAVHIVPESAEESIRIETNQRMVLAEQTFVVQVNCAVEMVLACMSCSC